ncbi:hypothetical protein PYCC9005_005382 [Savitreella phatthalungensis]
MLWLTTFSSLPIVLSCGPPFTTIHIASDSTAASYNESRYPLTGWGQVLGLYFDPCAVCIDDRAIAGRSSRSFMEEGAWQRLLDALKPADYAIIQFGHNDGRKSDPKRYTPIDEYKTRLTQMVEEVRVRNATAILTTPVSRRYFDSEGVLQPNPADYAEAARDVARETGAMLNDLQTASVQLYRDMGHVGSAELFMIFDKNVWPHYPAGLADNTHFQRRGAVEIARLWAENFEQSGDPLTRFLAGIGDDAVNPPDVSTIPISS